MASEKRLSLNNGRVLVSAFLALMGFLFTASALIFEPSPARWTVLTVAGLMFLGALIGFIVALRHRS